MNEERPITGGCLCGAVRFQGALGDKGVVICHCKMCRRGASGPLMATRLAAGVSLTESRGLQWWAGSEHGERGFCRECGATLFWRTRDAAAGNDWSVSAGVIDGDPEQHVRLQIYVDRAPNYYDIAADAPRIAEAEFEETYSGRLWRD